MTRTHSARALVALVLACLLVTAGLSQTVGAAASGTVEITGDPASSGTTYTYDLADASNAANWTIDLTGVDNSQTEQLKAYGADPGDQVNIGAATDGNADPTGESIKITAGRKTSSVSPDGRADWSTTFTDPPEQIIELSYELESDKSIRSDWEITVETDGTTQTVDSGSLGGQGGDKGVVSLDITTGSDVTVSVTDEHGAVIVENLEIVGPEPNGVSVSLDTGGSVSLGDMSAGESTTITDLNVTTATESLTVSSTYGEFDVVAETTEHTVTENATVTVNGEQVASVDGRLANGSTETVSPATSALVDGTNTVEVDVKSAGAGAPSPQVRLDYAHDASTSLDVSKERTAFRETVNATATFATDTNDATVRVPLSDDVTGLKSVSVSDDGSDYTALASEDYVLEEGAVVASLGSIQADTTVSVRVVANRMRVENGSITVVDRTLAGNTLDSKIRVDSTSGKVAIVGNSSQVMYGYRESWDNPRDSSRITADGTQRLRLPGAVEGSTLRVTTVPLEVTPESNDVVVSVEDAGTPLRISVSPGETKGDQVEYAYRATINGNTYVLWDVGSSTPVDTDQASSPAVLSGSDKQATYEFREQSPSDAVSGGGGGPISGGGSPIDDFATPVGAVAALLALGAGARRFGGGPGFDDGSYTDETIFGVGALLLALALVLLVTPSLVAYVGISIGRGIERLLADAGAPVLVLGILAIAALGWRGIGAWRDANDTEVTIRGERR